MRIRFLVVCAPLALAGGVPAAHADDVPAAELAKLLVKGGKHWSLSPVGFTGFRKYDTPGKLLHLWPARDVVHRVVVDGGGAGVVAVDLRWQLQPGQRFPERFPEYLTYQWGEPGGKAHGFNVVKGVGPAATSGTAELRLAYSKAQLDGRRGEQDVVLTLFHGEQPAGGFVRVRVAFPGR